MKYVWALLATYVIAWTLVYAVMMGFDFSYFFSYLWHTLTLDFGERGFFIWFLSLGAFIPMAIVVIRFIYRRDEKTRRVPTS